VKTRWPIYEHKNLGVLGPAFRTSRPSNQAKRGSGKNSLAGPPVKVRVIASSIGCYIQQEPDAPDMDAEAWAEIRQSSPGFIAVHARKDNIRADSLVTGMSNTFHIQRSYSLPPDRSDSLVWLQIGPGSIWRTTP
jgi:hypothetical protein